MLVLRFLLRWFLPPSVEFMLIVFNKHSWGIPLFNRQVGNVKKAVGSISNKSGEHRELMRMPRAQQQDTTYNYIAGENDDFISSESDRQTLLIKYMNFSLFFSTGFHLRYHVICSYLHCTPIQNYYVHVYGEPTPSGLARMIPHLLYKGIDGLAVIFNFFPIHLTKFILGFQMDSVHALSGEAKIWPEHAHNTRHKFSWVGTNATF